MMYLTLVPFPSNWDYAHNLLPLMSQGLVDFPGMEPFVLGLSPLVPSFDCISKGVFCANSSIVRFGATAGKCTCIVAFKENGETRYGAPLGGPIEGVVTVQRLLTYKQFQSEVPQVTPLR